LCQSQQFVTNVAAGKTLNWAVNNVVGGNANVGTISTAGVYKAPQTAGTYTVTAVSTDNTFTATATAAVTDLAAVWTAHNDNARTGANTQEYALTPAVLQSGRFHKLWSCPVDGQVLAQPLYVAGVLVGTTRHNVLFVATHNDSVYAFDADDPGCTQLWKNSFVNGTTIIPAQTSCGDTPGAYGIQPTPVIDMTLQRLYVLVVTSENGTVVQRLHALSLATGQDAVPNVAITATDPANASVHFNPAGERPRAGIALSNGGVFLTWAAFCDPGSYEWHGWLMRYDSTTLTQTAVFNATPNPLPQGASYGGGGIWMSSGTPAIDSGGAMYLSTGNGDFTDTANNVGAMAVGDDFGMGVLKFNTFVPNTLEVQDFFVPRGYMSWSFSDFDVSASAVTLLPAGAYPAATPLGGGSLAIAGDKQGHVYVLDQTNMGKLNAVQDDIVQSLSMPGLANCQDQHGYKGSCFYATPAYYNGTVYLGTTLGPVIAIPVSNSATPLPADSSGVIIPSSQTLVPVDNTVNGVAFHFIYPSPNAVISASPTGNGIAWVLDNSACGFFHACGLADGNAALFAYDAANLGANLYAGNATAEQAGGAIKFNVPTVANGHVYVGGCVLAANPHPDTNDTSTVECEDGEPNWTNAGTLTVYGLKP
jgi:PQQ-like domain